MRNTLANIKEHADERGLIPIQIDGIPEGFSYITPMLQVGKTVTGDDYIAFIPNTEWRVRANTIEELLTMYNKLCQNK